MQCYAPDSISIQLKPIPIRQALLAPKCFPVPSKSKSLLLTLLSHPCVEIPELCLPSWLGTWNRKHFQDVATEVGGFPQETNMGGELNPQTQYKRNPFLLLLLHLFFNGEILLFTDSSSQPYVLSGYAKLPIKYTGVHFFVFLAKQGFSPPPPPWMLHSTANQYRLDSSGTAICLPCL